MLPAKGTWARAEHQLQAAMASVVEAGKRLLVEGRSLFVGYLPESIDTFPAAAYQVAEPYSRDTISREGTISIFNFEIALFGKDRDSLIALTDTVLTALRATGFKAQVASTELDGPGTAKQINLRAEMR